MSTQTADTVPSTLRVIEPKLMLPRIQPGMLRRARLLEMLDRDGGAALTMHRCGGRLRQDDASALVVCRAPGAGHLVDPRWGDDDPVRLWTHLATAVERLGGARRSGADVPRRSGRADRDGRR